MLAKIGKSSLKNILLWRRSWVTPLSTKIQCQYMSSNTDEKEIDLASFPVENIRNFSIIAHVDHGKSTLADRLLEFTGAIKKDSTNKQVLDKLQVEKDRGITVKAQSASIVFNHQNKNFLLNLVDTPGHVDFSYEVFRSLSACDGVILIVDANQGVQAQTVANFYQAFANDLVVIPVLNKIDLKNADPDMVTEQLFNLFDMDPDLVLKASAKMGIGIQEILEAVVDRIPAPTVTTEGSLRALVFDTWFEPYKGVNCQVLVKEGELKVGDHIQSCHSGKIFDIRALDILTPTATPVRQLYPGQVGVIKANIKKTSDIEIGDTFRLKGSTVSGLPGFAPAKPMVFAGVYPMESKEHTQLSAAISKLTLNDASVSVAIESSAALGFGWRLGFLGLLHMDVFNERLDNEYDAQVVFTTPSVTYKAQIRGEANIKSYGGEEIFIKNPAEWPDPHIIVESYEPMVKATIVTPTEYVERVLELCDGRRGTQLDIVYTDEKRKLIYYKLPLSEVLIDFFDALKGISSGYASFDYEDMGYEPIELVKLNIKLNGELVNEFATIVPLSEARATGRRVCLKLKEYLPQQQFTIPIQAVVGSKVIAREDIKALRKNVTAKCYGGDVSRKMKLLKQQAEGKKRLKSIANMLVPRETFVDVLKR